MPANCGFIPIVPTSHFSQRGGSYPSRTGRAEGLIGCFLVPCLYFPRLLVLNPVFAKSRNCNLGTSGAFVLGLLSDYGIPKKYSDC